jgi:hypothetical protein
MSILPPGLSETVTLRHKTGADQYGDPSFADSSIFVIWFDSKKVIRQNGKEDKICNAFLLTEDTTIAEGDAITRGGVTWSVGPVEVTNGYFGMSLRVVGID